MDNFVYGLTKKQTSPTSPLGYKSKTDPTGAIDQPVNPIKKLLAAGATFIARTHATQINHMIQMMDRAMDHDGFSVIECLSECVEFYPGAFDAGNPRKGGEFKLIDEKKWDGTPEDEDATMSPTKSPPTDWPMCPFPGFSVFTLKMIGPPKTPSSTSGLKRRGQSWGSRPIWKYSRRRLIG